LQFNIFNLLISISCSIKLHATAWLKYGKICSLTENNIIIIILHHEKMKISNTISCRIYLLQKYKSGLLFTLMNTITIPNVHVQVIIHPSLRYEFHGVMCLAISAYKRCSVRLYLQLYVWWLMFYLRYMCLLAHSGVQYILCSCWVFWGCFFFFVLCTLCCQFLWIVLFWLPHPCSLTFIYTTCVLYFREVSVFMFCFSYCINMFVTILWELVLLSLFRFLWVEHNNSISFSNSFCFPFKNCNIWIFPSCYPVNISYV
jgi:hypothetical protein